MDNVDEETLKKFSEWLPTYALPGEEGMCVIYGHSNRQHLQRKKQIKM